MVSQDKSFPANIKQFYGYKRYVHFISKISTGYKLCSSQVQVFPHPWNHIPKPWCTHLSRITRTRGANIYLRPSARPVTRDRGSWGRGSSMVFLDPVYPARLCWFLCLCSHTWTIETISSVFFPTNWSCLLVFHDNALLFHHWRSSIRLWCLTMRPPVGWVVLKSPLCQHHILRSRKRKRRSPCSL